MPRKTSAKSARRHATDATEARMVAWARARHEMAERAGR